MKLKKIAKDLIAKSSEKEVERLLKKILPSTKFRGKTFAVGGYNRDELLGLDAKDLDIVVEMKDGAKKITKFLKKEFPNEITKPYQMGASYPIWQITFQEDINYKDDLFETKGAVIEFADTMKESFPDENSRQRETSFGTLKEDVERRDFTVNSLLKDLSTGEFIDLTGTSIRDIEKGILQGNPGVDFDEILRQDPLRMIRLVRFQAKYGWKVPLSVLKAVKRNAKRIKIVSKERITAELVKIGKVKGGFYKAIRLMKVTGLLKEIMPEIDALRNIKQQPDVRMIHLEGETVFHHTMEVLKHAQPTFEAQLSALLHDVGKKDTQEFVDGKVQFLGHEQVSGEIAEAIMKRLKIDSKTIKKVKNTVVNHMRPHSLNKAKAKSLRKFIREIGDELEDVLDLAHADGKGTLIQDELGNLKPSKGVENIRERLYHYRDEVPVVKPKPPLNGREIMKLLNINQGHDVGRAVHIVQDIVDEHGFDVDKQFVIDELLERY